MPEQMVSCVLHNSRDVRLEKRPLPNVADGRVLVKMKRMGICGTDLHYFERGPYGRHGRVSPFILGHEGAGEIVEIGKHVDDCALGTRVAIDPSQPCRLCSYCTTGQYNLCAKMRYLGSAATVPPGDGLFCEYLALPAGNCYPLPDTMSFEVAALMEPLSVSLHAVKRAGPFQGHAVLIMGGGPIGQLTLLAALAFGAGKVALSEPTASRRANALRNGAHLVLDPGEDRALDEALDFSNGGFAVIFEAAGAAVALQQAFDLARPGGTIVQIGGVSKDTSFPAYKVMPKELNYIGSFRFANVFPMAIAMAASHRIKLHHMVTHTLPLAEFDTAMQIAKAREDALKVQLTP